jgi:hypothetical protein
MPQTGDAGDEALVAGKPATRAHQRLDGTRRGMLLLAEHLARVEHVGQPGAPRLQRDVAAKQQTLDPRQRVACRTSRAR